MAITTTTISKAAGWARTDTIDQLEKAFTWLGWHAGIQTGIVTGITDYSGGGTASSQVGLFDLRYYTDAFPISSSGIGTGASFQVVRYNGAVNSVYVNRPGAGYTNGEYVVLSAEDIGGAADGATGIGITVFIEGGASPVGFGSTNTFYDKDVTIGATTPWGVLRHTIQPNKKFGDTYRGFQVSGNTLYQVTGSAFHPSNTENTANRGNGRRNRFAGTNQFDLWLGGTNQEPVNNTGAQFTTSSIIGYSQVGLTYSNSTSYDLDLNIFRSGLDPNFAVLSFRHPTLSSTTLSGNTYATFIIHNFTTSIWDLDDLFLGGTTVISPSSGNSSDPYLDFTTYLSGSGTVRRTAEYAYNPNDGYRTKRSRYYASTYPTSDSTTTINLSTYFRENTTATGRGTGGTYLTNVFLPSDTNYNAVIKGIPLNALLIPSPYYIPDDFVLINFDYNTPSANIQQWDTVTISGSEVYTVIQGSYNQDTRTRGILFCARTV